MSEQIHTPLPYSTETITHVQRWSDQLFSFRITRPAGFDFKAGQYVRLGLPIDGQMVWRAYSITSGTQQDWLEFLVVSVPGGAFTGALDRTVVGDPIHLDSKRFGFMTPDRFVNGDDLWMIATGTGLGPYVSMLQETALWNQFARLIVVHGVRHSAEFAYADSLREMAAAPPFRDTRARLALVHAVTRDSATAPDVLHGRITALLDNGSLEQAAGTQLQLTSARVMLCGNPAMIEDMRALLHARGLRPVRRALPGQFVTENYW